MSGRAVRYTDPDLVGEVVQLYVSGSSLKRTAAAVLISTMAVRRILQRSGVSTRPMRIKATSCVDCGKPTDGSLRCTLHKRLRLAEINRMAARRYKRITADRWQVADDAAKLNMQTITVLQENEIFVFGSNIAGRHGKGAARQAMNKFGAKYGIGEGRTGQCYAVPTLGRWFEPRTDEQLKDSIRRFRACAKRYNKLTFLLTKVGCGLAGYTEDYMKSLFVSMPANVRMPDGW